MASEQIKNETTTTTKTDYEQQLVEELWKNAGTDQQKNENDQSHGQGQGQMQKQPDGGDNNPRLQGLPLESSPYVKYSDLEDYKRKAYGTEGHLEPKPMRQTGADAPTLDGPTVTDYHELGCGK